MTSNSGHPRSHQNEAPLQEENQLDEERDDVLHIVLYQAEYVNEVLWRIAYAKKSWTRGLKWRL